MKNSISPVALPAASNIKGDVSVSSMSSFMARRACATMTPPAPACEGGERGAAYICYHQGRAATTARNTATSAFTACDVPLHLHSRSSRRW